MATKIGVVVSHPIQYQAPLFRRLTERGVIDPKVLFTSDHGLRDSYDPGFGRGIRYDIPLTAGYSYEFLKNLSPWRSSGPLGSLNPGLSGALRRAAVDYVVVHGWGQLAMFHAYYSASRLGIPYAIRCEARIDQRRGSSSTLRERILRSIVSNAGACLAIGSLNREFYLEFGADEKKIISAPYSVDTARFRRDGERGREQRRVLLGSLGLDPERPTIIVSAKLQAHKRPIDAVRGVERSGVKANLLFVGDGALRCDLEKLAGGRPWMRMLGFVNQSEIGLWYGAADMIVLPSEHEPWGLAINEAMAAGAVPIVTEAVGCAPDLVQGVGWVYPAADVEALGECIARACTSLREELRRAVVDKSETHSIEATCCGYENALAL